MRALKLPITLAGLCITIALALAIEFPDRLPAGFVPSWLAGLPGWVWMASAGAFAAWVGFCTLQLWREDRARRANGARRRGLVEFEELNGFWDRAIRRDSPGDSPAASGAGAGGGGGGDPAPRPVPKILRRIIPAPPEPYLPHSHLLGANFTWRAAERQQLSEWYKGRTDPVTALLGAGGVGKSSLAWVWLRHDVLGGALDQIGHDPPDVTAACRLGARSRPQGAMWWSFDRPGAEFSVFLDDALEYYSAGSIRAREYLSSPIEKLKSFMELLQQEKRLLVLDGFERTLSAYASLEAVYRGDRRESDEAAADRVCAEPLAGEFLRRMLARPVKSKVLLVSRLLPADFLDPTTGEPGAGCRIQELPGLAVQDGVGFLKAEGLQGATAALKAAVQAYRGHPLALRLLSGAIRGGARSAPVGRLGRFDPPRSAAGHEHEHIADEACKALSRGCRALLGRMAAIGRPATTDTLALVDPFDTQEQLAEALAGLVARGLVQEDAEGGESFDLHPIVRSHAYAGLSDKPVVHALLADYLGTFAVPVQVTCLDDVQVTIERYHHLIAAGEYEAAWKLFQERLAKSLEQRFAAYTTSARLLGGLFPDGEVRPPRLSDPAARAAAVDRLAAACSYAGQTRRAAAVCEANLAAVGGRDEERALLLDRLAGAQVRLGRLKAAEQSLRALLEILAKVGPEERQALVRARLGLLLACRGAFDESVAMLDNAYALAEHCGAVAVQSVVFGYFAQRALLLGDPEGALEAAHRARACVEKIARTTEPDEHDFVRSGWMLAASLLALALHTRNDQGLTDAEKYLADAFARCRRGNLVGFEPDLLLTAAQLNRHRGRTEEALQQAQDVLSLAARCEYRLKLADAQLLLSGLAADAGDAGMARTFAEHARRTAWCDGTPYCYLPTYNAAEKMVANPAGRAAA